MSYSEQIDLLTPAPEILKGADYPFVSGYQLARAEASLIAEKADEEITRLKKALRIADEAVNIATDSGVY